MNIEAIDAISRTRALTVSESAALYRAIVKEKPSPRRWSHIEDRRLVRIFTAKRPLSKREMATALGRSIAAVNIRISFLRRQGKHLPGRGLWRNCDVKGVRG